MSETPKLTGSCSEEGGLLSVEEGGEEGVAMQRREFGEGWKSFQERRDPNLRAMGLKVLPHRDHRSKGMRLQSKLVPGHDGSVCALGCGYHVSQASLVEGLLCRFYQDLFQLKS